MSIQEIYQQFIEGIQQTTWLEYIAVFAGIASVWFSRIENIWVYPSGLINTIFYVYLSIKGAVAWRSFSKFLLYCNEYLWMGALVKKDATQHHVVNIAFSNRRWWIYQLMFFSAFYLAIFFSLTYLKRSFAPGAIPWADAFASATAFTGMWLMTKKKVESWYWWLATNIASIPLYFVKHYVFTSVYYVILFVMAVFGLLEWMKRARSNLIINA